MTITAQENLEMATIAGLLANQHFIHEYRIQDDWFTNSGYREIFNAITFLKDTDYRLEDVYNRLKSENILWRESSDDLYLLADSYNQEVPFEYRIHFLHQDYINRELHRLTDAYSKNPKPEYAERLEALLSEQKLLSKKRDDGKLSGLEELEKSLNGETGKLLKSFTNLDGFTGGGVGGGQLIVIGARPATGKTAMALSMMMKVLNQNENIKADFFSLEMNKMQLVTRLISFKTQINSMLLRDMSQLSNENKNRVRDAYNDLSKLNLRLFGAEYDTIDDIKHLIRKRVEKDHYIAFVDYAGLIKSRDSRKNERQVMNEVTRELKLLTNELDIPIVLLAQLNRAVESRQVKKPTLADLKESGSLEQDANVVMLLSKSDEDNPKRILCEIAKNREGRIGITYFKFDASIMDFDTDYNGQSPY